MIDGIILHSDDMKKVTKYLTMEQCGVLFNALYAFSDGREPGEMDPAVGIAFEFISDRMQREADAYEKKAERNRRNGQRGGRPEQLRDSEEPTETQPEPKETQNNPKGTQRNPEVTHGNPEKPTETQPEPKETLPNPNPNRNPITQKDICAPDPPAEAVSTPAESAQRDQPDSHPPSGTKASKRPPRAVLRDAEALFEKLWERYPNKKGKGKVSDSRKIALLDVGEEQMLRALERYIDEHETRERKGEFTPYWQNGSTFFNSGYLDYLDSSYAQAPPDPQGRGAPRSGFVNFEQSGTDWGAAFEQVMLRQMEEEKRQMDTGSGMESGTDLQEMQGAGNDWYGPEAV